MQGTFVKFKNTNLASLQHRSNLLNQAIQKCLKDEQSQSETDTNLSQKKQCRICLSIKQPLISPCLCRGSMQYVHELCLIQWLLASQRKKCELCQFPIQLYEERLSTREILRKTISYLKEDKKRFIQIMVYFVYLWILKYKLVDLIGVYFKTLFKVSAMKMLKILYNAFIIMLVVELAFEEYGRIKAVIKFFRKISVSVRIKGNDQKNTSETY